jgi:UPF0755 protein
MQPTEPTPSVWRTLRPLFAIAGIVAAGVALVTVAANLGERVGTSLASDETVTTVEPGIPVTVEIPNGASGERIGEILQENGVIASAAEFEATVRVEGLDNSLRAGSYDLETGMESSEVVAILSSGPTIAVYDITVREGLRVTEVLDVLAEGSGIDRVAFESSLLSGLVTTTVTEINAELGLSAWEGLLFPDTYRFSEQADATDILNRMASTMEQRMDSVDWSALEASGLTRYEGVILASLIESEVRVAEERPIVSSVLRNRIADGQRLEIDATVLYGLDTRDAALFNNESDSPYNTYRVDGLPPTPISAPGLASLQAAAQPADTEFRYYVLADESGAHAFAVTFDEHLVNVERSRAAGLLGG